MSNVLPDYAKKRTWRLYRARFIGAGSLLALACAAFTALALTPAYLALSLGSFESPEGSQDRATQEDRLAVAHTQALIAALSPLAATSGASSLIEEVVSARPSGVVIQHITVASGHPGSVVLSGTTERPELINDFQNSLKLNPLIISVSVPVSTLAGTADGMFSITITANI